MSSDSDGTVVDYAWDFGDGVLSSGSTTAHSYAEAGTYSVTLVVTDQDGATGSVTRQQVVSAVRTIAFRAASTPVSGNGVTSAQVMIPTAVQPGDGLLLVLSTNSSVTAAAPSGFTSVGNQSAGTAMTTQVWQKVADAADAGRSVTVSLSGTAKITLGLVAYAGTDQSAPVLSFAGASETGGSSHTTPVATAPNGAFVLSPWADKSTSARSFTAPAGVSVRIAVDGAGTGDLAALFADNGPVVAGPVGGLTSTVSAPSSRATMLTVVLAAGT